MPEFTIKPVDVFHIISRRKFGITLAFILTFGFVMGLYVVLPRVYQGETILHIGVNYFQNPLIGDLVSQTHDPGELRSEREKVIEASLGVDFATKMGEKYKLFETAPSDKGRSIEIEYFLKSLDISPVTATQFRIKYKSKDPDTADGVIRDALDSIRQYMFANRIQMLEQFFGVLDNEITRTTDDNPGPNASSYTAAPRSDAAKAQLAAQIEMLQKKLEELRRSYNDQHPSVQGVKSEIAELQAVANGRSLSPALTRHKVFQSGAIAGLGVMTIKDDLNKQKHLVNISLEMEKRDPSMSSYITLVKEPVYPKSPLFPKLKLFLLFGLVAGVLFATLTAALLEFWQGSEISPARFAKLAGLEILGELSIHETPGL